MPLWSDNVSPACPPGALLRQSAAHSPSLVLVIYFSGSQYCSDKVECGGWAYCPGAPWPAGAPFPTGHPAASCPSSLGWMQSSAQDAKFMLSAGGLLFPRANIGAGAFWNFRDDIASDSAEMLRRTDALAASMAKRGVIGVCPPGCSCSFGSRCGDKYKPS